jgi:hypothetical protein
VPVLVIVFLTGALVWYSPPVTNPTVIITITRPSEKLEKNNRTGKASFCPLSPVDGTKIPFKP